MSRTLIAFDRRTGRVIENHDITSRQGSSALLRLDLEDRYREQRDVEVVVLTAESDLALRKTHGRYFESVHEIAGRARAGLG